MQTLSLNNYDNPNIIDQVKLTDDIAAGAPILPVENTADLTTADLSSADLSGANLSGADLSEAMVKQSQIDKVKTCQDARLPKGITCH